MTIAHVWAARGQHGRGRTLCTVASLSAVMLAGCSAPTVDGGSAADDVSQLEAAPPSPGSSRDHDLRDEVLVSPFGEPTRTPLVIDPAIPVRLLTIGGGDDGDPGTRYAIVDLHTGTISSWQHRSDMDAVSFAGIDGDRILLRHSDESVEVFEDGLSDLVFRYDLADLESSTMEGSAPSVAALRTNDGHRLWVIQPGIACCGDRPRPGQAELVDLATGELLMHAELAPNSYPVARLDVGLVLNHQRYVQTENGWVSEEGSHEVHVLTDDGELSTLGAGEALAATDETVLITTCDSHEPRRGCRLLVTDPSTRRSVVVDPPADGVWSGVANSGYPMFGTPWPSAVHEGRVLLQVLADPVDPANDPYTRRRHLVILDTTSSSGPTAEVAFTVDAKDLHAAWDADGQHILVVVEDDDVRVLDPSRDVAWPLSNAIPEGHWVLGIG